MKTILNYVIHYVKHDHPGEEAVPFLTLFFVENGPYLSLLQFICIVVLYYYVVILMLYLTMPSKCEVWHATIPGSTHHFFFKNVLYQVRKMAIVISQFVSVCVTFLRCVSVVSFVFSYIWVWIHITIRRVTVLFYPKFMYLVLMLYLLFSWDFVWCLVRFCVCYVSVLCRCSPLIVNAFPSVLVCYPDFVFCPWIYEFWTAVYYCCLYLSFDFAIWSFYFAIW